MPVVAGLLVLATGCTGQTATPTPPPLEPVTIQLQWIPQAQFAGYYVALEKGWYREEGIELTIVPGGPDIDPLDAVASGARDFGTSLLADLVVAVQQGKPLVSIGQIQQKNGLLLVAKKSSGIQTPTDFAGKRVGVWLGSWEAQFNALMAKEGLGPQDFELVSQGFTMDSFLAGNLDVASAMIYNEYHMVLESGVSPDELNIIDYGDYGLAFPGDVLFTSRTTVQERPQLCAAMLRATLRGWKYAIEHPDEAVEIVLKYDPGKVHSREHQQAMMAEMTKLVQESVRPIGYTDRNDVRHTVETLLNYGIISQPVQPEEVFTNQFWEEARTAIE